MDTKPTLAPTLPDLFSLCHAATEHAPLAIAAVEGAEHIVRQVNPAFCRLMDTPKERLIGQPFHTVLPGNPECLKLLERVYRTGKAETNTGLRRNVSLPGSWSYVMWPVLTDERPLGVLIQITEATQFHETALALNEQLMLGSVRQHELTEVAASLNVQLLEEMDVRSQAETEKDEQAVTFRHLQKAESLSRMAGAVAHTFNNQLGAVIGNLEIALMDLPEGEPINCLKAAMQAAEKAAMVSGQILTYLGQSRGERELFDLAEACQRNLPILRAIITGKVQLEIDLRLPGPVIEGNTNQILQIVTNLITNAREAIGVGGGTIHLAVKTILAANIPTAQRFPVDWQPQVPTYAVLELVDTGCGIAVTEIEKVFDPFFSSKFPGRGMGLAVVMGIVTAHGGAVTVESETGRGSTFHVFLPASAQIVLEQTKTASLPFAIGGGGTVLLVEDEVLVREMTSTMVKRLGLTVLEATDGVEAIELFRQNSDAIHCVLCDLTMPRMDGWETIAALHQLAPDVPVIMTSGYSKAHVMTSDHSVLPQFFLSKPYSFKDLREALGQALSARRIQ